MRNVIGRGAVIWIVLLALVQAACAARGGTRTDPTGTETSAESRRAVLAGYVQNLRAGTRVRVHLADGRRERGTLMNATPQFVVVQPGTRIPEPPLQIPLDRVIAVEVETSKGGVGRAIGIGLAAGAGAALGVLLLFAAIYGD